jgi:hypothetical protein
MKKVVEDIKVGLKTGKVQGGLQDDLSAFYCCRRRKIAIKDLF